MKKSIAVRILAFLMLIGSFSLFYTISAQAAVSAASNVAQTNAGKDSITVTWAPSKNASEYHIYCKEWEASEYTLAGVTTGTEYTITGLKDGTKYYVQVKASDGTEESYGASVYNAVTLPSQVTGLRQERWWYFAHSLDLKWDKKSGVRGYEVTLSNSKGKVLRSQNAYAYASGTTLYNLKDSVYTIKVRAYTAYNNNTYYSSYSSINCIPQARINKIQIKNKKLTFNWKKVDGATGYQIYVSMKPKKGYKLAKTVGKKTAGCTLAKIKGKKINPKKTYYVYVKTICKKGKKKGTSGALYYWSSKTGKYDYLS